MISQLKAIRQEEEILKMKQVFTKEVLDISATVTYDLTINCTLHGPNTQHSTHCTVTSNQHKISVMSQQAGLGAWIQTGDAPLQEKSLNVLVPGTSSGALATSVDRRALRLRNKPVCVEPPGT